MVRLGGPAIHPAILMPLLWMAASLLLLFVLLVLLRTDTEIDRRRLESRGAAGMSNHAAYILSAYLVALVILGGLVIASLAARRRVRRELAERGLEAREQRAR